MKKINNKYTLLFCLVTLFVILGFFHSSIGLYFDDYGNASLSYGYDAGVNGLDWTLSDLGSWAKWIYFNFSGRIMCGSLLNLLVKLGNGSDLFMAIQVIVLVFLFWVMYRIVMYYTKQECNVAVLVLGVALFFQMPSDMYRWNLCWASASVLYIWPLLPFLLAVYLQLKLDSSAEMNKKTKLLYTVICLPCILFVAFSHEQTGLSIAVYMLVYVIGQYLWDKRVKIRNVIFAVAGIVTYAFLFFAPGNWLRLDGNTDFAGLSFIEKIAFNIKPLLETLFWKDFFIVYFLISVCLVIISYMKRREENKKIDLILSSASLGVLIALKCVAGIKIVALTVILELLYLLIVFAALVSYNYQKNHNSMNVLLIAAAASAFCVLISPTLPARCFTEWILVIHIMLLIVGYDIYERSRKNAGTKFYKICLCSGCIICLCICKNGIERFGLLYKGYLANAEILENNDEELKTAENQKIIYLNKLENDYYSPVMPYNEGYEFIEYWMKQYYNLEQDVKLVWIDHKVKLDGLSDRLANSVTMEGDFYEDQWFGSNGEILISNSLAKKLNLYCRIPEEVADEQEIEITVNGEKSKYSLQCGDNNVTINLVPGENNTIVIEAPEAKQMSENDLRKLSFVYSYYFSNIVD